MKSVIALSAFALLAVLSGADAACNALNIINQCVSTIQTFEVDSCNPTDFKCRCAGYSKMSSCYQSCPDDAQVKMMAEEKNGQQKNFCASADNVARGEKEKKDAEEAAKKLANNETSTEKTTPKPNTTEKTNPNATSPSVKPSSSNNSNSTDSKGKTGSSSSIAGPGLALVASIALAYMN